MKEVPKFHEGDHVRNGEGDHDRLSDERYKLQEENKKLKSIAAESIDAAIKAEDELADLRARIKERLDHYESLISKGKGEWPNNNYVRDSTWDSWHGARCVLNSLWQAIKVAGEGK